MHSLAVPRTVLLPRAVSNAKSISWPRTLKTYRYTATKPLVIPFDL